MNKRRCHAPVIGGKDDAAALAGTNAGRRCARRAIRAHGAPPPRATGALATVVAPPGAFGFHLSRQRNIHAIVCAASPLPAPGPAMHLPRLTLSLALLAALAAP
ncbi:MAG: hypothetical protein L0H23_00535, partial [Luteimonas sp.]|nr:hypothetical protein [Luteimonas sp.]